MTIVEQIVAREIEAVIIYESKSVIAFADHEPINFGHILVCPTFPYESFIDLPDTINNEIQRVARELYKKIKDKFSPDGISLMQNNGNFNELSHYHLHIFPRYENDKFGWQSSNKGIQSLETLRKALVGI